MTTVTLESGRTYGVLFEITRGETAQVAIEGISAQSAQALRPDGKNETLVITEGVMEIPASLTDTESYVQLRIGDVICGFRVVAPKKREKVLIAQNLLDNSDFVCPVNQRGLSAYAGIGYTIDRWKNVTTASTLTIVEGGIEFVRSSSASAYVLQYLSETNHVYYGKTYTFALGMMDGSVHTVTAAYPEQLPTSTKKLATTSFPGGEIMLYTRSKHPSPYVQIRSTKADQPLRISWAAVYEGEMDAQSLPAYQPKGYAAERVECERYFARISNVREYAQPYYDVTKHFREMRALPTAKILSADGTKGGISVQADESQAAVHVAATLSVLGTTSVRVTCNGGAGVYAYNDIELTADL